MAELQARLQSVAQSGDYLETRRVGEEHAELEASLQALYEEWSAGEGKR